MPQDIYVGLQGTSRNYRIIFSSRTRKEFIDQLNSYHLKENTAP
jgi:hypothetical protein